MGLYGNLAVNRIEKALSCPSSKQTSRPKHFFLVICYSFLFGSLVDQTQTLPRGIFHFRIQALPKNSKSATTPNTIYQMKKTDFDLINCKFKNTIHTSYRQHPKDLALRNQQHLSNAFANHILNHKLFWLDISSPHCLLLPAQIYGANNSGYRYPCL